MRWWIAFATRSPEPMTTESSPATRPSRGCFAWTIRVACCVAIIGSRSSWRAVDRTRLYRLTETVGRWSMVDIYVVTILVALVKLGNLASIEAEVGAVFFGGVVVVTILAAESFDPRLIWDRIEQPDA